MSGIMFFKPKASGNDIEILPAQLVVLNTPGYVYFCPKVFRVTPENRWQMRTMFTGHTRRSVIVLAMKLDQRNLGLEKLALTRAILIQVYAVAANDSAL